jgi:hypothetical protein
MNTRTAVFTPRPIRSRGGGSWTAQLAQEIVRATAFILLVGEAGICQAEHRAAWVLLMYRKINPHTATIRSVAPSLARWSPRATRSEAKRESRRGNDRSQERTRQPRK